MSPPSTKVTLTRLLILTHHIISRKKIHSISLLPSLSSQSCSILFKSGKPPGIFLCEFNSPSPSPSSTSPSNHVKIENVEKFLESMRKLRYKDFRIAAREDFIVGSENAKSKGWLEREVKRGEMREVKENLKEFAQIVDACDQGEGGKGNVKEEELEDLGSWWRRGMGWGKE